jgi:chemotaxis response regulator CheB
MSIRVLLIDDSDIMRRAIARTLEEEASLEVVGEGTCFADAVELCGTLKPDVLVLDLHMPDEDDAPPGSSKISNRSAQCSHRGYFHLE